MPDDQSTDYRAEARRELNGWLTNWGPTIEAMIAGLLEAVDEIDIAGAYPEDHAHEIADLAIPVHEQYGLEYTSEAIR